MPRLDVLSAPAALQHPRPTAGLSVSRPTWFHVPLPRGAALSRLLPRISDGSPIEGLSRWLLEKGGRHRLELRLAGRGQHAGAWFGIAGVGATPRDAAHTGKKAAANLADVLDGFSIAAQVRAAPDLPRQSLGLRLAGGGTRLQCASGLATTRATLPACGVKGAPLVLARVDSPAVRATRIRDEAAGMRVRVLVHGRRFPSPLRLRLLSDALGDDLDARVRWGAKGEALSSGTTTLLFSVAMLAAAVQQEEDMPPF